VVAVAIALFYPLVRQRIGRVGPARRARLLTALCVAPLCVAVLQTGLFFLPGMLGVVWPEMDHCLSHAASGHAHLCFAHPPGSAGAWLGWVIVGAVTVVLGRPLVRDLARTWRSARLVRSLLGSATPAALDGVRVVDSPLPLAAATALGSDVLVSSALVSALSPDLLEAVVAHERAHIRRRDPWRRVAAMVLSAGQLPATRRALLDDLELASEQASDEEAALAIGHRVRVAQALLAVSRLLGEGGAPTPATAIAFDGSSIEARVASLLAPPIPNGRTSTEVIWLLAVLTLAIASADPGHHLTEHVIDFLGS
jgi:Zn-dependent protease with chaperone function